jgi:tRNA threonylcarbamoyladenosine biosynthesis protein TsaB
MIILALDTTLSACSAALVHVGENRIFAEAYDVLGKGHGEAIGPMVQQLFEKAQLYPNDLSRIAVTYGPGTFTGLRIGLAFAHGMSAGLGCPCVGINTLAATAAPLLHKHAAVTVIHEAGATGKFYAARFEQNCDLAASDHLVHFATLEDCLELCHNATVIGTGATAVLGENYNRPMGFDLPRASLFASATANFINTKPPQPLYLREPDAKPPTAPVPLQSRMYNQSDIPRLAALHAMSFDHGWPENSFEAALALPGATALVVEQAGDIRGFIQLQTAAGETEINTICVEPRWRKRGFARQLLRDAVKHLNSLHVAKLHLDVAEDNLPAYTLYKNFGFIEVGRRKGYYARAKAEPVAALLMSLEL